MWSLMVVSVGELVVLGLQVVVGPSGRLGAQPLLQCLLEAFDLALGLGVVGAAVLLVDAEDDQFAFEVVGAVQESRGEDQTVVRQRGCGDAVGVDRGAERGHDDVSGHWGVGGAAQRVAGVVVQEREDLYVGAVGQGPV